MGVLPESGAAWLQQRGEDSQEAQGPVQTSFRLWSAGLQRVQGDRGHQGVILVWAGRESQRGGEASLALQTSSILWLNTGFSTVLWILCTICTNNQAFPVCSLCPARWTGGGEG